MFGTFTHTPFSGTSETLIFPIQTDKDWQRYTSTTTQPYKLEVDNYNSSTTQVFITSHASDDYRNIKLDEGVPYKYRGSGSNYTVTLDSTGRISFGGGTLINAIKEYMFLVLQG